MTQRLSTALSLLLAVALTTGCDDTRSNPDSGTVPPRDAGGGGVDSGGGGGVDAGGGGGTDAGGGGTDAGPGPASPENTDALCGNGVDDDGDGLTDCADDSCHGHPFVTVCVEDCTSSADDDLDGFLNCEDRDCYDTATCLGMATHEEAGAGECGDGVDNDGDGFTDCADFSCQGTVPSCNEADMGVNNCSDGIDNNSHSSSSTFGSFVDCTPGSEEFQCQQWGHCPAIEATDAQCSDGIDNDDDGFVDCDDRSCQRSVVQTVCDGNAVTCSDGLDNDEDGFTDCGSFACRCCPGEGDSCGTQRVTSTCRACAG